MTRYLISFNDGAMDHIPDEDMPAAAAKGGNAWRAADADGGRW